MRYKLVLLLFVPLVSSASQWVDVSVGSKATIRVDASSIVTLKNGNKKAWIEYAFVAPKVTESGKSYQRSLTQQVFNCAERSVGAIQDVLYDELIAGSVVESYSIPIAKIRFDDVVPDSFAEATLEYVCRRNRPPISSFDKK